MLEARDYSKAEIAEILHTADRQGIRRKLQGYGVVFDESGRGDNAVFSIKEVSAFLNFKLFCIIELDIPAQTDFEKFRDFLYYFMNDEEMRWLPDEGIEEKLKASGASITRQTAREYINKLMKAELITVGYYDYVYYLADHGKRIEVSEEEYNTAWREFFENSKKYDNESYCYSLMKKKYHGIAMKRRRATENVFEAEKWNRLNELVCQSIEAETGKTA